MTTNKLKAGTSTVADYEKELNRVLNALALELPPAVHKDATGRIRALFESAREAERERIVGIVKESQRAAFVMSQEMGLSAESRRDYKVREKAWTSLLAAIATEGGKDGS